MRSERQYEGHVRATMLAVDDEMRYKCEVARARGDMKGGKVASGLSERLKSLRCDDL